MKSRLELLILLPPIPKGWPSFCGARDTQGLTHARQSLCQLHIPSFWGRCSRLMNYVRAKRRRHYLDCHLPTLHKVTAGGRLSSLPFSHSTRKEVPVTYIGLSASCTNHGSQRVVPARCGAGPRKSCD